MARQFFFRASLVAFFLRILNMQSHFRRRFVRFAAIVCIVFFFATAVALATDYTITGRQAMTNYLPGTFAVLANPVSNNNYQGTTTDPWTGTVYTGWSYAAVVDTGASGNVLSFMEAQARSLPTTGETYSDVGIGGAEEFNVSVPTRLRLQAITGATDTSETLANYSTYGDYKFQVRQADSFVNVLGISDPLYINIVGTPVINQHVMHVAPNAPAFSYNMDAFGFVPINYTKTELLNSAPSTLNAASSELVLVSTAANVIHVPLTYENFVESSAATTSTNPMIHGVSVINGGQTHAAGEWLFDSGASVTMVSNDLAAAIGINVNTAPVVATTTVMGVGGAVNTINGYHVDGLAIPTTDGTLTFSDATIFVLGSNLNLPANLPGIFGMNLLHRSFSGVSEDGTYLNQTASAFNDWYVIPGSASPPVYWTGMGGTTWSTATGLNNWKNSGGTAADYAHGAAVTFDDRATGTTVNISAADVSPASVTFNNSSKNFTITGTKGIVGATSVVKLGTGAVTLNSVNTYTGLTTVKAGVLELGVDAQAPVLTGGGADIQGGKLVFDYTTADPATTILSLLKASYNNGAWDIGKFRNTTAASTGLTLGWLDDALAKHVTIMATLAGDANLDGKTDATDLNTVLSFYNQTGTTWWMGDFNYDGKTDATDLNTVLSYYNQSLASLQFANLSSSQVPEPSALTLLTVGLLSLLAYAWRKRK